MKDKRIIIAIVIAAIIIIGTIIIFVEKGCSKTTDIFSTTNPVLNETGYDYKATVDKILFTTLKINEQGVAVFNFHRTDINKITEPSVVYDKSFNNIQNIQYAPDGSKANFLYQESDGAITNAVYDFGKNEVYKLNSNIEDIVFSKDSAKLIYIYRDSEKTTLNISDIDGKNYQVLKNLEPNILGYFVISLGNDQIAYAKRHAVTEIDVSENVYLFNLKDKSEQIIYNNFVTFNPVFSPDGKKFIANFLLERPIAGAYNNTNNSSSIFFLDYDKTEYTGAVWLDDNRALMAISDYAQNQTYLLLLNLADNNLKKYVIASDTIYTIGNLQIAGDFLYYSAGDKLYSVNLANLLKDSKWTTLKSDVMKTPPDME
jgi:hypothetical protein